MRLRNEVAAAGRVFMPTEKNSFREKALLIAVLVVWIVLEIGGWYASVAYGARMPPVLDLLRQIVLGMAFYTFGRVHAKEVERGSR